MVETIQSLSTRPLTSTFLPVLGRHPAASAEQQAQYLNLVALAALLCGPVLAGLALVAPELTGLLLNSRYRGADVVLSLLAVAGMVAPLSYFRGVALTAALRPGVSAWLAAEELVSVMVCVWVGADLDLRWAAAAVAFSSVLLALITAATLVRVLKLRALSLLAAIAPPYVGSVVMAAAVLAARPVLGEIDALPRLVCLVGLGAATFGAYMIALHRRWLAARLAYVSGARSRIE